MELLEHLVSERCAALCRSALRSEQAAERSFPTTGAISPLRTMFH